MSSLKSSKECKRNIQDIVNEIIEKNSPNDSKEMSELVIAITPKLKQYVFKFHKNEEDIFDVCGNIIEKILTNFKTYNTRYHFTTWMYSIAKYEAMMYQKSKMGDYNLASNGTNQTKCKFTRDYEADSAFFNYEKKYNNCSGGEDEMIHEIFTPKRDLSGVYAIIVDTINNMPDSPHKNVILESKINQMKGPDIARKYNMNENTVKTKLREAKTMVVKMVLEKHPSLKECIIV